MPTLNVQSLKSFTIAFWTESSEQFPHPIHRLTYALRRLGILSQTEDSLWMRFSALARADPCLRLLGELEQNLKDKVRLMTVRRFAPKTGEYLIHTADIPSVPPYNTGCLHPNGCMRKRGFTNRRYVESS